MTPFLSRKLSLSLTYRQILDIMFDLGHEEVDVKSFWQLAMREARDPGCIRRERSAHIRHMARLAERVS